MQSSSTFIRISGPIPEVTENLHWSLFEIVLLNIGKNPSKARYCRTGFFCSKYSWASAGCRTPGKLCNFYSFKLENSTSSTLTGTKLFCKYEYFFFFLKNGNLIINWVPLSPTNILCLKDYPHNVTKYMKQGGFENTNFYS